MQSGDKVQVGKKEIDQKIIQEIVSVWVSRKRLPKCMDHEIQCENFGQGTSQVWLEERESGLNK